MKPKHNPYASSELFTPARLLRSGEAGFLPPEHLPRWASSVMMVGGGEEALTDELVYVYLQGGGDIPLLMRVSDFIALCELTRFGGGIVPNSGGKTGDSKAILYPKMTMGKPNRTLRRIIVGAGGGVRAVQGRENMKQGDRGLLAPYYDLRPEALQTEAASGAKFEAQETAIAFASKMARKYAPKGFDVDAYVANIRDLFAMHDECFA